MFKGFRGGSIRIMYCVGYKVSGLGVPPKSFRLKDLRDMFFRVQVPQAQDIYPKSEVITFPPTKNSIDPIFAP